MVKEPFFSPQPTRISCKRSVTSYYTMTGNDNSYIILSVGSSNGSYGFNITILFGQVLIADGFSIRYSIKQVPNLFLKLSTILPYGNIESPEFTLKISAQLRDSILQDGMKIVNQIFICIHKRSRNEMCISTLNFDLSKWCTIRGGKQFHYPIFKPLETFEWGCSNTTSLFSL